MEQCLRGTSEVREEKHVPVLSDDIHLSLRLYRIGYRPNNERVVLMEHCPRGKAEVREE